MREVQKLMKVPATFQELAISVANFPETRTVRNSKSLQYWVELRGGDNVSKLQAMLKGWEIIAEGRGLRAWANDGAMIVVGVFDQELCMEIFTARHHFDHAIKTARGIDYREFHESISNMFTRDRSMKKLVAI
jgi:hypothetical protein